MDIPKILPVNDREDMPKEKPLHINLPKPPCLMLLCSPIRTGKSTIISNLYLNDNFYGIIDDIVSYQNKFEKKDMPAISICLDDCLGTIRREAKVNHLASRFRHYNIKLLMISSQKFRHVSPVIRTNATAVIVGSPFPNQQELDKVFEEYGDQFGGYEAIKKLYKMATPERYNFLFLNLAENPPEAYKNFETLLAKGTSIVTGSGNEGQVKELENSDED